MLVVADSSPLNVLIRIGCIDLLPRLFGDVLIPPEVRKELSHPRTPPEVREFANKLPGWLRVRAPASVHELPLIGKGEAAAINLAREIRADALLIDDKDGRRAATGLGIAVVGTLGVLERASEMGLVEVAVMA